jgi:hypothetical protein
MSIFHVRGADLPAVIDRPITGGGPTQVSVGIWIADITSIDSAQQSFTAEIAVVLRWKDPRLAHTGNGVVRYPIEQVWHPRVSIVNETNAVSRKFPDYVEVEPDGTVNYRQRYAGAFTQPLRLRSFPLDRQTFRIQLVAVRYRTNEVTFVPDQEWINNGLKQGAGIAPSITLPDWTIEKWVTRRLTYALAPGFDYSGYAFEFTVVGGLLDYSERRGPADQRRSHFDAYSYCLSIRHRQPTAASPIHNQPRCLHFDEHRACLLFFH